MLCNLDFMSVTGTNYIGAYIRETNKAWHMLVLGLRSSSLVPDLILRYGNTTVCMWFIFWIFTCKTHS